MGRSKLAHLPAVRCELRNAVGADGVDTEGVQGLPLRSLIGRPRHDSGADRMCSLDNLNVDGLDFLPEILRSRGGKASDRINVS